MLGSIFGSKKEEQKIGPGPSLRFYTAPAINKTKRDAELLMDKMWLTTTETQVTPKPA
jgi:hypothetical protein